MVTAGLALLLGAFTSQAQSGPTAVSTNASGGLTTVTFFASAENYLTTFNPDYTWTNVTLEAATGYKQVTGTGAASVLDVQYDLGRWNLGTACQFSGVGKLPRPFSGAGQGRSSARTAAAKRRLANAASATLNFEFVMEFLWNEKVAQ